jgi:hypothetical protein
MSSTDHDQLAAAAAVTEDGRVRRSRLTVMDDRGEVATQYRIPEGYRFRFNDSSRLEVFKNITINSFEYGWKQIKVEEIEDKVVADLAKEIYNSVVVIKEEANQGCAIFQSIGVVVNNHPASGGSYTRANLYSVNPDGRLSERQHRFAGDLAEIMGVMGVLLNSSRLEDAVGNLKVGKGEGEGRKKPKTKDFC